MRIKKVSYFNEGIFNLILLIEYLFELIKIGMRLMRFLRMNDCILVRLASKLE